MPQSGEQEDAVFEAPAVLRMLWADPQYMPEHLALWSLKRFGPRASAAVERLQAPILTPTRASSIGW